MHVEALHVGEGPNFRLLRIPFDNALSMRDAIAKHPEDATEQQTFWRQKTGKSRASFYRTLNRFNDEIGE